MAGIERPTKSALEIFTTCPRESEVGQYSDRMRRTASLTQAAGFKGILIYTGNEVPVEPWLVAGELAQSHPTLSPFIAVNPVYMHPFTVARCIAMLAQRYGTRCHLNLIAGTSLADMSALDEADGHDQRYDRLREFALIVRELCRGDKAVSFEGKFFGAKHLRLPHRVPSDLQPVFFVAGQSPAAQQTAQTLSARSLGMLQGSMAVSPPSASGVHMGIIARDSDDEAWAEAYSRFPEKTSAIPQHMLIHNTDASWKKALLKEAEVISTPNDAYWLGPFLRGQLDCPLLIGSVETVARCLDQLIAHNVRQLVLELHDSEKDYMFAAAAIQRTKACMPPL
ncbi:LLM class flavin-dependent oxidoreductase [Pseudomonas khavaziana]|uniref:LLM class flavin-dependent oxidoreductase n=1 Tax=Pseudomonas khavaziana TaxID=2842351 RepID=A0ABZ2DFG9_9PSED